MIIKEQVVLYKLNKQCTNEEPLKSLLTVIQDVANRCSSSTNMQIKLYGDKEDQTIPISMQLDIVKLEPYLQEYNVFTVFFSDSDYFKLVYNDQEYKYNDIQKVGLLIADILVDYGRNYDLEIINNTLLENGHQLTHHHSVEKNRLATEKNVLERNLLIESNLRLVGLIVSKYANIGEDLEDLISIGTIGLIKAVDHYRPNTGVQFQTFACRSIENEIIMHFNTSNKKYKNLKLINIEKE